MERAMKRRIYYSRINIQWVEKNVKINFFVWVAACLRACAIFRCLVVVGTLIFSNMSQFVTVPKSFTFRTPEQFQKMQRKGIPAKLAFSWLLHGVVGLQIGPTFKEHREIFCCALRVMAYKLHQFIQNRKSHASLQAFVLLAQSSSFSNHR